MNYGLAMFPLASQTVITVAVPGLSTHHANSLVGEAEVLFRLVVSDNVGEHTLVGLVVTGVGYLTKRMSMKNGLQE